MHSKVFIWYCVVGEENCAMLFVWGDCGRALALCWMRASWKRSAAASRAVPARAATATATALVEEMSAVHAVKACALARGNNPFVYHHVFNKTPTYIFFLSDIYTILYIFQSFHHGWRRLTWKDARKEVQVAPPLHRVCRSRATTEQLARLP